MLIMFKARNYTSFKDEVVLDLRATNYKQHPSHLLEWKDNENLLKTVAIYGANASGKSNLISAMFLFEQYIFNQFISRSEEEDFSEIRNMKLEPFKLAEDINDVSEFEIIFTHNGKQIQYGFECTPNEVVNEWYLIDDKMVFERAGDLLKLGHSYNKLLKPYRKVIKERLHLAVLEYFLDEEGKEIILYDFVDFFDKKYDVFFELFLESSIKSFPGMVRWNDRLANDEDFRVKVEKYVSKIDVGIKRFDIQEQLVRDEKTGEEKERKIVKTVHDMYNYSGNVIGERFFDLHMESTGTLRFISYIQEVIERTERGGVLIVDEISARLHPLLTKLIIDIFQSSENTKAQLVFTTHDTSLLNKDQFRRDEVVFINKNDRGESVLSTLSDLKVREDATFHKDYLRGKYGAIPIFKYDDFFGGAQLG